MNIWIISAFDPTPVDNTRPMRFMGIAEAAVARGHRITYFSNTFRHATREMRFRERTVREVSDRYRLVFVYSNPYSGNLSVKRLLSHRRFGLNLMKETKMHEKPHVVFISMPPLTPARRISAWASGRNIPVVLDIIDPWPDAYFIRKKDLVASLYKLLMIPLSLKLNRTLSRVNGVTAISGAYLDWARKKARQRNGRELPGNTFYPAVQFREIREQMEVAGDESVDKGILQVVYAGSLESSYDIPSILRASEIMASRHPGKTKFIIAGKGSQEEQVKLAMNRITNLEYLGRVDQNELIMLFSRSHVGLIQHTPGATQTVTYKLFDYLGAGLAVVNSLKSEMGEIIEGNRVGFNHEPGDAEALAGRLEQFLSDPELLAEYRKNALELTAREGDARVVYKRLIQFLEKVSAG